MEIERLIEDVSDCAPAPLMKESSVSTVIEQLVWGKYCESTDGPIIKGAEHSILGRSVGFPEGLVPLCEPTSLGISKSQFEETEERLFERVPYGTALRPVRVQGRTYAVLFRVGIRSEGGNDRQGRRSYSVGRYLVDPTGRTSPTSMFQQLEPLGGTTREAAASLRALAASPFTSSSSQISNSSFVKPALTYLVAGVPIHIRAKESDFFVYVDELWRRLPETLRVFMSAGWNVSSSVADGLAIRACAYRSGRCSEYANSTWREPSEATHSKGTRPLIFGELYAARWLPDTPSELEDLLTHVGSLPYVLVGSSAHSAVVPAFSDVDVRERFQEASLEAAGDAIVQELRRWIATGHSDTTGRVQDLLACVKNHSDLPILLCEGFADRLMWSRTDHLYWAFLTMGRSISGLETMSGPGVKRALLFEAARDSVPERVLSALAEAARAGEAARIPEDVSALIRISLDATIGGHPALHDAILPYACDVDVYAAWAVDHAFELAIAFTTCSVVPRSNVERIADLLRRRGAAVPGLPAIARLVAGDAPLEIELKDVGRLPATHQREFARLVKLMWDESATSSVNRDRVLDWSAADYESPDALPEVFRVLKGVPVSASDLLAIVLGNGGVKQVPERAWPALSESVLQHSRELRAEINCSPALWEPLLAFWPADITQTVLGPHSARAHHPGGSIVPIVGQTFAPPREHVQALIEEWLLASSPKDVHCLPRVARVLWNWAASSSEPGTSDRLAVDVCRSLARGRFQSGTLSEFGPDQASIALTLTRLAGQSEALLEMSEELWRSAVSDWQLQILLELFPKVDFKPDIHQLIALLPRWSWLRRHLSRTDVAASRLSRFAVSQYQFGEITPAEARKGLWVPELEGSLLAGAFQGEFLGERLTPAIRAYSSSPREAMHNILTALIGGAEGTRQAILTIVCRDFVCRWASRAGITEVELRRTARAVMTPEPYSRRFVSLDVRAYAEPFSGAGSDRITVADYVVTFFWHIAMIGASADFERISSGYFNALRSANERQLS